MKAKLTRAGLLCVALTTMSMALASAAMALKITPVNNTIQLKATNMKLHVWGTEAENITCELWQTSGKISAFGTLPVSLEAPTFGKGNGECSIVYGGLHYKGRITTAGAEKLEALQNRR